MTTGPCARRQRERGRSGEAPPASALVPARGGVHLQVRIPMWHADAAETRTDLSGDSECRVVDETLSAGKAARRRQRARPTRSVCGNNQPPGTMDNARIADTGMTSSRTTRTG